MTENRTGDIYPEGRTIPVMHEGQEIERLNIGGPIGLGTSNPNQPLYVTNNNADYDADSHIVTTSNNSGPAYYQPIGNNDPPLGVNIPGTDFREGIQIPRTDHVTTTGDFTFTSPDPYGSILRAFNQQTQKYYCEVHGELEDKAVMKFDLNEEYKAQFCLKCLFETLIKHGCAPVTEITENAEKNNEYEL